MANLCNPKIEWKSSQVPVHKRDDEITFVDYDGYYANRPGTTFYFYVEGENQGIPMINE